VEGAAEEMKGEFRDSVAPKSNVDSESGGKIESGQCSANLWHLFT
jgi:hypothetical protein